MAARRIRGRLAAVVMALLAAGAARAQTGVEGTVRTIDGRELTGRLTVDERGVASLLGAGQGAGAATALQLDEILRFDASGVEVREVEVPDRVWLRSGLELPARRLRGIASDDKSQPLLEVQLPCGVELTLPLGMLRALRHGGLMRPQPTLFPADLLEPAANEDLLYVVKDGKATRSSVVVTGFTQRRVDFELRGGAYDFELDGVAAIVFGANTGFAPDRQPRPRVVVDMVTGEHIEGRLMGVGDALRCRLDEGCEVVIARDKLLGFRVASDRLVWLGELTPQVDQTPAFDRVWPWHVDRTVAGSGFELRGRRFDRGIGMVPRTRLTYTLDGRFDTFEATIGIDDRGGPEAHAIFRVLVDGVTVFESDAKTRGDAPDVLRVPLAKAKLLAIEADFGKNYDLGDLCVFADARVVQQ